MSCMIFSPVLAWKRCRTWLTGAYKWTEGSSWQCTEFGYNASIARLWHPPKIEAIVVRFDPEEMLSYCDINFSNSLEKSIFGLNGPPCWIHGSEMRLDLMQSTEKGWWRASVPTMHQWTLNCLTITLTDVFIVVKDFNLIINEDGVSQRQLSYYFHLFF